MFKNCFLLSEQIVASYGHMGPNGYFIRDLQELNAHFVLLPVTDFNVKANKIVE